MKQLFTYVTLCLIAVMMVAAIGKDQMQKHQPSHSPSPEIVQELTTPDGEPVVAKVTEGNEKEAQTAENAEFHNQALALLNMASKEKLSLKEKIAVKVVRGKLKKDVRRIKKGKKTNAGDDQLIALLLCIFLGGIGVHRFYLGYIGIGVIQLLTAGLCGIWTLIDLIRIILGTLKPKDGEYSNTL